MNKEQAKDRLPISFRGDRSGGVYVEVTTPSDMLKHVLVHLGNNYVMTIPDALPFPFRVRMGEERLSLIIREEGARA